MEYILGCLDNHSPESVIVTEYHNKNVPESAPAEEERETDEDDDEKKERDAAKDANEQKKHK